MSEEPTTHDLVDRVRVILEAADRADFDTILRFYDDEAVWVFPEADLTFEGVDAIRGFWEDWYGGYEDFHVSPPVIVDLGNGVILAVVRHGGRLGGGPAELREGLGLIYEWADGLVVRVTLARTEDAQATAERIAEERG
jgi:hypothetical protein